MMKRLFWVLVFAMSAILLSCLEGGESDQGNVRPMPETMTDQNMMAKVAVQSDMGGDENPETEKIETRKLIKDARLAFETNDMESTRKKVAEIILKYNASVDNENEYKTEWEISNNMTIRVRYDLFEQFVEELIANEEKVTDKSINVQDVTAEFIDVEARLRTQRELENRYLEILKRGNTVTELLEVERALASVRSEIESYESRLKFMSNQVAHSTINLRFFKTIESKTFNFGEQIVRGFQNGWIAIQWFIVGLVNLWAFLIVGTIVFFIIYRAVKKSKKV